MSQSIYQFANFQFDPQSNLLTDVKNVNTSPVQLDPKVSALLAYFLTKPQTLITKSELFTNVWQDHKITDSTVSWALSQLRKALGDYALSPTYVKTVPKQGFQFLSDVTIIEQPNVQTEFTSTRKWLTPLTAFLVVALFSVFLYQYSAVKTGRATLSQSNNVTALDGLETDPELSPNQNWLLFRHKASEPNSSYQLFLTVWSNNKSANLALNLSQDNFRYLSAVWGENNNTIYAARQSLFSQYCEIVKLSLNTTHTKINQHSTIQSCHKEGLTQLAYQRKRHLLYFTNQTNEANNYSVYQLNLNTNVTTQLTHAAINGDGDHFISLSVNQNQILILRTYQDAKTDFLLLSPNSKKSENVQVILRSNVKYETAHLSPDGESLWFNANHQQPTAYRWKSKSSRQLLPNLTSSDVNVKAINQDLIMMSTIDLNQPKSQSDIKALTR
mgnify:CR=1 FL=1